MRTETSIKNAVVAFFGQLLGILLSFISRSVFVWILNTEYLGVNGLFTDVLSILSLAEMGFGTAIVYSLYKPLAVKDEQKIKALMNFYAFTYKIVGSIVLTLGLCLLPFLKLIIKDAPNISNLNLIYLLFLFNSVATYTFAYKRSLIIANQKNYIVTLYRRLFFAIVTILQIFALIMTKNFILYLMISIIFSLIENIVVSRKADKMYPILKKLNDEKLEEADKKELLKNVKALAFHRLGAVAVDGTDNILVSSFVGIIWVGLYSNYLLIVTAIYSILNTVFDSITASIGNLNAIESKEKSYDVYTSILFINFWIVGFCTIALWILLNPFITLWLGNKYLMNGLIVTLIVLNFYIRGMRKTTLIFKDAFGLFWNDRFKPILELIVNLTSSIILVQYFGIIGILFGTMISTLTTAFWIEPYVLYKNGFHKHVRDYFIRFGCYFLILILAAFVTKFVCSYFEMITIPNLIIQIFICLIIPNSIFLAILFWTKEFKYVIRLIKGLIKK